MKAKIYGQVITGINNIYTVALDSGKNVMCRIKGKVFKSKNKVYNPISVGDWVGITIDELSSDNGCIIDRKDRKSFLVRYNKKRRAPQVIAANVDLLVCVTSLQNPPFRPRFIDRMLVCSKIGNIEPVLFVNKCDIPVTDNELEFKSRLESYKKMGFIVIYGSALEGTGLKELSDVLKGKICVFAGQSGVGKSSILNGLKPGLNLRVGEISQKYNRGAHITNFSIMISLQDDTKLIDTPGIRELEVYGIISRELSHYFSDFNESAESGAFTSCNHIEEPECKVKEDVDKGIIHPDRYESYKNMYYTLKDFETGTYGQTYNRIT